MVESGRPWLLRVRGVATTEEGDAALLGVDPGPNEADFGRLANAGDSSGSDFAGEAASSIVFRFLRAEGGTGGGGISGSNVRRGAFVEPAGASMASPSATKRRTTSQARRPRTSVTSSRQVGSTLALRLLAFSEGMCP